MQTKEKIYCLFKPYTAGEVGLEPVDGVYYPKKLRKLSFYANEGQLLNAYANTRCPASQMIVAKDDRDLAKQIDMWNKRYDDVEWLEKNLWPYL